jgi:hypothetical protein
MKFQKAEAYPEVKKRETELPTLSPAWWDCITCDGKAGVLHKGTAYCRACYDRRNHSGTLVD